MRVKTPSLLVLLASTVSSSSFAMGNKPINWDQALPHVDSAQVNVILPGYVPTNTFPGSIDAEDLFQPTSISLSNSEALRAAQSAGLDTRTTRSTTQKTFEKHTPQCQVQTTSRSETYQLVVTHEAWVSEQSLWCRFKDWLYSGCAPENTADLFAGESGKITRSQSQSKTDRDVSTASDYCSQVPTPPDLLFQYGRSPIDELNNSAQKQSVALDDRHKSVFEKSTLITANTDGHTKTYSAEISLHDRQSLKTQLADLVTPSQETITTTRTLVALESAKLRLTKQSNNWGATASPAQLLGFKTNGKISVKGHYQVSVTSDEHGTLSNTTEIVTGSKTIASRSIPVEKDTWRALRNKHSEWQGPYILRASSWARDQTLARCDLSNDSVADCGRLVMIHSSNGGANAEVIDLVSGERLKRPEPDTLTPINGDDLFSAEGDQIDVYEARFIKSGVTTRFPKDRFNYFIDGQSAAATLGNLIGGVVLGITIGHFERLILPKETLPTRIFFEVESIGSVIWIPTKDLLTLEFEYLN